MIFRSKFLRVPKTVSLGFLLDCFVLSGPILYYELPCINSEYQNNQEYNCPLSHLHGRLALLPLALPKLLQHRHLQIIAPIVVPSDRLSLGYALEARDGVVQALRDV